MPNSQGPHERPEREKPALGWTPGAGLDATLLKGKPVSSNPSLSQRQAARQSRLPDLFAALLDPTTLGATLRHCFNSDTSRDALMVAYGDAEPRPVFSDDEARLCCRLEELGFDHVSAERLRQALDLLPHTPEHDAHRSNWVQP